MVVRLRLQVVASLRLYRLTSPIRRIMRLVLRCSFRNRCRKRRKRVTSFVAYFRSSTILRNAWRLVGTIRFRDTSVSRDTVHSVRSLYFRHLFLLYSYLLVVYPWYFAVLVYPVFRFSFFVVFVGPMEGGFVRVSSCRTGRANGKLQSLFVFRVRVRFRVIVSSPLGPVIVITSFAFHVFVSFVFVSHVIRHVDSFVEVRSPSSSIIVVTSRSSVAPAIVVFVSLIPVSVALGRSFETWTRVR